MKYTYVKQQTVRQRAGQSVYFTRINQVIFIVFGIDKDFTGLYIKV